MGRLDEEPAAFELLTLSNFEKWSTAELRTFHNDTIIITNKSGSIVTYF